MGITFFTGRERLFCGFENIYWIQSFINIKLIDRFDRKEIGFLFSIVHKGGSHVVSAGIHNFCIDKICSLLIWSLMKIKTKIQTTEILSVMLYRSYSHDFFHISAMLAEITSKAHHITSNWQFTLYALYWEERQQCLSTFIQSKLWLWFSFSVQYRSCDSIWKT